ncbi:RidA family protein [Salicibibacter cibi]|uniref:RidA family protein n=1 Tax=Salicibibacter cibi TaxID=2743001 RepID=A0A7T6Z8N7_9BACI|nr:RidA family protein [Salicibibacter cibi]QQK78865.1 RidA family protein [Salicibibacter cibi]
MKEKITTSLAPEPAGQYSQGVKVGNRIYVAGQTSLNVETGSIPDSLEEQTRQVFANIKHVLAVGGATLSDVVKVNVYLVNLDHFDEFNSVFKEFFTEEPFPVRTTVGSKLKGIEIEIDIIAEIECAVVSVL